MRIPRLSKQFRITNPELSYLPVYHGFSIKKTKLCQKIIWISAQKPSLSRLWSRCNGNWMVFVNILYHTYNIAYRPQQKKGEVIFEEKNKLCQIVIGPQFTNFSFEMLLLLQRASEKCYCYHKMGIQQKGFLILCHWFFLLKS